MLWDCLNIFEYTNKKCCENYTSKHETEPPVGGGKWPS